MDKNRPPDARRSPANHRAVIGPRLRRLLALLFLLAGLLFANSLYLLAVRAAEAVSGELYQEYFYQLMFLLHLAVGLLILLPAVVFGALHLRNAWRRPNFRAVRAGLALFLTILLLLISGLVLVRFDFFSIRDPLLRDLFFWIHVITPLMAIWLFVLHRLAGRNLSFRPGVAWAAVAVVLVAVSVLPQVLKKNTDAAGAASAAADVSGRFFPSLARTSDDEYLSAGLLMMDGYCQECHADVHERWQQSAHRFSSFNNPAYRFAVMNSRKLGVERDGDTHASRFCAGCHDPVPFFSGAFDDPSFGDPEDPLSSAGITCTACHAITRIDSPRGNADFTIEAPRHYPFTFSGNTFLQWLNRQLLKAKPEFHKKTFLKPLHREPGFCGSCHKVHIPPELNGYKWLRGQNHQDSYHLSGVSGHGASSFYYPASAVHNCAGCHMPLEPSDDFGAAHFDGSGRLTVHDHLFPGANTALPHLRNAPEWVNRAHVDFLREALRVDIFGLRTGGTIEGPLAAPLRPGVPRLEPGRHYLLDTVLRTLKPGHLFTEGTADSNEVWLEVTVRSGDEIIGRSGHLDHDGQVDPWSHFLNVYLLDRDGERIDRRNVEDIFTPLYNHQIPPGAADVVHFAFTAPPDRTAPISVEVKLNYRKFDTVFLRHFLDDPTAVNDLPVTVIARDEITFDMAGGTAGQAAETDIPAWERWNDYGIGLLRKAQRGELRQAEYAFRRVEDLGRADGPLNLARVYLREGRLEDAAQALERASAFDPAPLPWLLHWLTGRVNQQNGELDEAIANYRHILNTDFEVARQRGFDFGEDFRVINRLGQALFERSKFERGAQSQEARDAFLREARDRFMDTLE
ncbi:MAG: hypothetical protein HKP03_07760, partial [Xanthomonadales bacterium]|nr:hypothetical protein [Xanthomonadales bacterium]